MKKATIQGATDTTSMMARFDRQSFFCYLKRSGNWTFGMLFFSSSLSVLRGGIGRHLVCIGDLRWMALEVRPSAFSISTLFLRCLCFFLFFSSC